MSRELDAQVAEKVMGHIKGETYISQNGVTLYDWRHPSSGECLWLKPYSTSIEAAWEVVEHLAKREIYVGQLYQGDLNKAWRCVFSTSLKDYLGDSGDVDTAPLAICLAALQAVEKGGKHG